MMKCPYCGMRESKVIDSRPTDECDSIRRRRECLSCGKRFTTYETVERLPLMEKRPVPVDTLMRLADEIEQEVQNSLEREISSRKIGELVMDRLKGVDEVAYVRFASVYRQFKDINTFMTELNKLLAERT